MIVTLGEAKQHLRIDDFASLEDRRKEDAYITILINAAEQFIRDGTGKTFDSTSYLAKSICLLLVADLYENRAMTAEKVGQTTRRVAQMLLTQLSFSNESGDA